MLFPAPLRKGGINLAKGGNETINKLNEVKSSEELENMDLSFPQSVNSLSSPSGDSDGMCLNITTNTKMTLKIVNQQMYNI